MIPIMNSQELNEIFKKSQDKNIEFEKELQTIKNDMSKKINIIKYENAFINQKLDTIDTGLIANQNLVSFTNNSYGSFNEYGYMVHPKFKTTPIDIMNLKLPNGDNFFRTGIIAKVNDIEKSDYISILMADNHVSKTIVFEEFNTDQIKLEYSLTNEYTLGTMRFNTIEIDPYIYGAYDLLSIEIYTLDQTNNISVEPTLILNGFNNIGRTRIILPEKIKFTKVIFNFKINFKTEKNFINIYPFGLKHIYFYNASFLSNSYGIIEINTNEYINFFEAEYIDSSFIITEFITDKFIEYVMNDMTLYTTQGKIDVKANQLDIEVYTDYENNTLINKVNLSSDAAIYRIAKNTKTLYIKIPLIKKDDTTNTKTYYCLNGLELNFTTNEEIIL